MKSGAAGSGYLPRATREFWRRMKRRPSGIAKWGWKRVSQGREENHLQGRQPERWWESCGKGLWTAAAKAETSADRGQHCLQQQGNDAGDRSPGMGVLLKGQPQTASSLYRLCPGWQRTCFNTISASHIPEETVSEMVIGRHYMKPPMLSLSGKERWMQA